MPVGPVQAGAQKQQRRRRLQRQREGIQKQQQQQQGRCCEWCWRWTRWVLNKVHVKVYPGKRIMKRRRGRGRLHLKGHVAARAGKIAARRMLGIMLTLTAVPIDVTVAPVKMMMVLVLMLLLMMVILMVMLGMWMTMRRLFDVPSALHGRYPSAHC